MVIRGILRDSDLLTLLSPDQVAMEVESGMLAPIDVPADLPSRVIGVTTRAGPHRCRRASWTFSVPSAACWDFRKANSRAALPIGDAP